MPAGAALARATAWLCEVEGAVWEGMLSKHLLPETFVLITAGDSEVVEMLAALESPFRLRAEGAGEAPTQLEAGRDEVRSWMLSVVAGMSGGITRAVCGEHVAA
uniref:Uncharacterized protein n=1 Tax=Pyramimonas obovata TaxID=1411642 RepID=A0A7S0RT65_9CHLO